MAETLAEVQKTLQAITEEMQVLRTGQERIQAHPALQRGVPPPPPPPPPPAQQAPQQEQQGPPPLTLEQVVAAMMTVQTSAVEEATKNLRNVASVGIPIGHLLQPELWDVKVLEFTDRESLRNNFRTYVIQPRMEKVTSESVRRDLQAVELQFEYMIMNIDTWFKKSPVRSPEVDRVVWEMARQAFSGIAVTRLGGLDVLMDQGAQAANYYAQHVPNRVPLPPEVHKQVLAASAKNNVARQLGVIGNRPIDNGGPS